MSEEITKVLRKQRVYLGFGGLEGLLNAEDFWADQPYGTRIYYGSGVGHYLHRDVLHAAIAALKDYSNLMEVDSKPVA